MYRVYGGLCIGCMEGEWILLLQKVLHHGVANIAVVGYKSSGMRRSLPLRAPSIKYRLMQALPLIKYTQIQATGDAHGFCKRLL